LAHPLSAHQRLPRYFTQEQLQRFFAVIDSPRDRAMFALAYQCGLRVGEIGLLRRCDLDLVRGVVLVRRLKRGYSAEHPLFASTQTLLAAYLEAHPRELREPLFPGRRGPLLPRQIQSRFVRHRIDAELPAHLTCHSLRHAIAVHAVDANQPIQFIQWLLGHRAVSSSLIYAQLGDRKRVELFRELEKSGWIVDATLPTPVEGAAACAA
jgi:integrase